MDIGCTTISGAAEQVAVPPQSMPAALPLTPRSMLDRALERGAGIDVVDKLMGLYERWEQEEARKAFYRAMARASAELPVIGKSKQVGFDAKAGGRATSYKYEDLADVVSAVKPILSKYGLTHHWLTDDVTIAPSIIVTCIITHEDGYSKETSLSAAPDTTGNKNSIQARTSTVTYLERTTLKALLGLAAGEDTDGVTPIDTTPINADQALRLSDKITEAGMTFERFKKVYNIEKLASLPAALLDDAYERLAAFKIEKAKAEKAKTEDRK